MNNMDVITEEWEKLMFLEDVSELEKSKIAMGLHITKTYIIYNKAISYSTQVYSFPTIRRVLTSVDIKKYSFLELTSLVVTVCDSLNDFMGKYYDTSIDEMELLSKFYNDYINSLDLK